MCERLLLRGCTGIEVQRNNRMDNVLYERLDVKLSINDIPFIMMHTDVVEAERSISHADTVLFITSCF